MCTHLAGLECQLGHAGVLYQSGKGCHQLEAVLALVVVVTLHHRGKDHALSSETTHSEEGNAPSRGPHSLQMPALDQLRTRR